MNKMRFLNLMTFFCFLIFGFSPAQAQKSPPVKSKTWSIHFSAFLSIKEGGRRLSINDQGNLVQRSKNSEIKETLKESDVQEISELLEELNLVRTKTRLVKGKGAYDYPYWYFKIQLNGKIYLLEGISFTDEKFVVLTEKQKNTFAKLKAKLEETHAAW